MPISDELAAVYATAPTDKYYIETLSLEHSGINGGALYLTNEVGGWTARLETGADVTFAFVPFAAVGPTEEDQANLQIQVAIDNVSRVYMDELERMALKPTEAIILKYRVYLSDDNLTVQNDPPLKLDVLSVSASQSTIAFVAGLANLRGLPFPAQLYTTDLYPGLAR